MKKVLLGLLCFCLNLPAVAAVDLTGYIYGKAMVGDVEGLRNLVNNGYSLESKDKDGNTAYCLAVYRRNQTAIRTLELAGVDMKPRCLRGTPVVTEAMIYEAAHNKNVKRITVWQEYGVPVDLVNTRNGNTALCQAVYEKDCEAIDILLKAGASEYHTCMRRVPEKVRRELDCKPVIIDWERVGLTVLGAGLVAGGVAVALSGGGSSGQSCAINEHWDGEKCAVCPAQNCWDPSISKCRVANKGEYIDPLTNRCLLIAPSPYTDNAVKAKVESFKTDEYYDGDTTHTWSFLSAINAANAYARGYTGYNISRVKGNNYGQLSSANPPSDQGQTDDWGHSTNITVSRPAIAILSSGTEIANTPKPDTEEYERYVNKDLAYEIEITENEDGTTTETVKAGTDIWRGNLATNSESKLFGFNFDYGYKPYIEKEEGADKYTGSQLWTYKDGIYTITSPKNALFDTSAGAKNSYYSGSIHYFTGDDEADKEQVYLVLRGGDCPSTYSFCGISAAPDTLYQLVDLKTCTAQTCLAPPTDVGDRHYDSGYVWDYKDPSPHYGVGTVIGGVPYTRSRQQGTLLAGIIAAFKNGEELDDTTLTNKDKNMHGVAYNARVVPAVADVFRPITSATIASLIGSRADIILQDVTLYNILDGYVASYVSGKTMASVFGEDASDAYSLIGANNKIFIIGTGMNGNNTITSGKAQLGTTDVQKDASLFAGVPLASDAYSSDTSLKDLFLSVTAVQPNSEATNYNGYTLTTYAQPCGSTAKYCLSAPGGTGTPSGNLISTVSTTTDNPEYNWGENYGTSSAAAVVAGAVAVLKGAYPHLSNQEIVKILEKTATPLGACAGAGTANGDSCISADDGITDGNQKYSKFYGWGLVNLDAATKPLGALWVNNGYSSALNPLIGTYTLSVSGVNTSSVMSQNLLNALPSSFTAFDSFNRPFAVNTRSFVSARSTRKEFDDDFKAFMHGRDVTKVKANDQFSMTYAPRRSDRSSQMKTGLMEMDIDMGKSNFGFYYTEDTLNSRGNYFERALNNPFVQIQEAYGADAKYNLTGKLSVGMSYVAGKNGFLGDGDKHYKAPENRVSMVATEANYQVTKSIMFKASYGVMKEQDSVLGMTGTGAFKTPGADTTFVSAGVEIKPTDKFKLNLAYTYGWTTPEKSNGLMNLSRLTADGFAAVAQYDLGSDNMLGLSVSSPLRVRSGKVAFDLPVGRSATDDTIYRETFTGSMKPEARELDFALFYKDALSEALTIQSELGVRLNPDHQKDASPDYRALFGLKWDY